MADRPARARIALLAVCVFSALYWGLELARLHTGSPGLLDDTWEYAVDARHLLQGDGFRTSVIHPPLWGLRDARLTVPVVIHGPVLPLLIAPALALLGGGAVDRVAWLAALLAVLTAVVLCRLGERHFGVAPGVAAALLYTLAPITLRSVHHDLSVLTGAFLLTLAFDLLARERPRHAAAAVALGLGMLVRPEMWMALAGFSVLAGSAGAKRLLAGVAIVCSPWWWHNWCATGSPGFNLSSFLVLGYSARWPDVSVLRDFTLPPGRWPHVLVEHPQLILRKALESFPRAMRHALFAPGPWTGWLAPVGVVVLAARRTSRRLAVAALLCALVPVVVMTFMVRSNRFVEPFLPLWALSASLGARFAWNRLPRTRWAHGWLLALAILTLPPTLIALRQEARDARPGTNRLAAERAALASRVTRAAGVPRLTPRGLQPAADARSATPRLMFSDTPDFVAWTTGRPTLWMTREEYARLPAPGTPVPAGSPPARGEDADTWFHDR